MIERAITFSLNISADEYLKSYTGTARSVLAKSEDGRRIRFPAEVLRPFVTHAGIAGRFCIVFDADNRFKRIERLTG